MRASPLGGNDTWEERYLGETALPASGPRPVRVRCFEFYRAARVRCARSASAAFSSWWRGWRKSSGTSTR
eukprot:gene20674-biopygen8587